MLVFAASASGLVPAAKSPLLVFPVGTAKSRPLVTATVFVVVMAALFPAALASVMVALVFFPSAPCVICKVSHRSLFHRVRI
jgi:hypothetical protein